MKVQGSSKVNKCILVCNVINIQLYQYILTLLYIFNIAQWTHSVDFTNKRVVVIGTGASAIQVIPEIAPIVKHLTVVQRTAPWVTNRYDVKVPELVKKLFVVFPPIQNLIRGCLYWGRESFILAFGYRLPLLRVAEQQAIRMIRRQIPDKSLQDKVIPNYELGCKRVLMHNYYYSTLARDNVDVVTCGIKSINEHTITYNDNTTRDVDIIVYATGFQVQRNECSNVGDYIGRNGVKLSDQWKISMTANRGITIANFPNLYFMLGYVYGFPILVV